MKHNKRIIWYHPDLKLQARELRNNQTIAEARLWEYLKGKQQYGYDFDRQKPIGYFIVDFFCNELSLIIEVDGEIHLNEDVKYRDMKRENFLRDMGLYMLRFTNNEVLNEINIVLGSIMNFIEDFERKYGNNYTNTIPKF